MVVRISDKTQNYSKVTKLLVKPLISGDSDFVSASKLARREGIDFILDPLGATIKPELFEHIDGLRSCDKKFYNSASPKKNKVDI